MFLELLLPPPHPQKPILFDINTLKSGIGASITTHKP